MIILIVGLVGLYVMAVGMIGMLIFCITELSTQRDLEWIIGIVYWSVVSSMTIWCIVMVHMIIARGGC